MPSASSMLHKSRESQLLKRLRKIGFPSPFITSKVLPDWYQSELLGTDSGMQVMWSILSRKLGLVFESLKNETANIRFRDEGICKFKRTEGTTDDELRQSSLICTRIAQIVASTVSAPYIPLDESAQNYRELLLEKEGIIDLRTLSEFLWDHGVPVIHISGLVDLKKWKKPHGFVVKCKGRPVIVICKQHESPAWLLFILAHEMGHIAKGHLPENDSAIIDEKPQDNKPDKEEDEANEFAREILTGTPEDLSYFERTMAPAILAKDAKGLGATKDIDPGYLILNYGRHHGSFATANAALKHLKQDNAKETLYDISSDRIGWDNLPEDTSEYLCSMIKYGD